MAKAGQATFRLRSASRFSFKLTASFAGLAILLGASGCSTAGYLLQATEGELSIFNHERPIKDVIADERTPPRIKALLSEIPEIKKFGEQNGLRPTKNYQDYVQLDRSSVVYVVSACAPLKFESKEWSFPIVGTFPYLGFFDLKKGREYAKELRDEGLDVDFRGASAFSTLGWFRDPVMSSMIPEGNEAYGELVNVVLHESTHATLYVAGQAYFNESLANFVADKLTMIYIPQHKGADAVELSAYVKMNDDYVKSEKALHEAYEKLDAIYKSSDSDDQKLEQKKKILEALQADLGWKREITNATLIQHKEYNEGTTAFETVYKACGSDTAKFLRVLSQINGNSFSKSQQNDLDPVLLPFVKKCEEA